ncbi:uncharacterized protein BCR38DRAFT_475503 [Pseudomassariella vexata]|uniref:Uncharacterized protein n=1 Tax=Pseudomassariella vexata TaxID=1141098 RepID=A0A1Y2DS38_9PEZI|nr:uncharacterized protein BCR38DRAFT_475503 [Pseudomassariella vexata]ORY62057.1 hypothetical protein BCR38DRAFT_475503 [Pseudomassariella vexata]
MNSTKVGQLLQIPSGEISFWYPPDLKPSKFDKKYDFLRVGHRGLRRWTSFSDDVDHVWQKYADLTLDRRPFHPNIVDWKRYASTERLVQDLYDATLLARVNTALDAVCRPISHLPIIGTPKYSARDTKLNRPGAASGEENLPGTHACPEAYVAQVVQYCIDHDTPLGFVLTNDELVLLQLIRSDDAREQPPRTRSSGTALLLPSDIISSEADYSSPLVRRSNDWPDFDEGDEGIPLAQVVVDEYALPREDQPSSSRRRRYATPEQPSSSQQSAPGLDDTPCPDPRPRTSTSPTPASLSTSSIVPESQGTASSFEPDVRSMDPTHVLIHSIRTDGEEGQNAALHLFTLIMLAKAARDCGLGGIGTRKLSFAALGFVLVNTKVRDFGIGSFGEDIWYGGVVARIATPGAA